MAAGLLENDWMFSANGIRPWHGIGEVITEAPSSEDAIKIAHLDWEVKTEPVVSQSGCTCDNWKAVVRQDNKTCLGMVGNRYTPLQNKEAFAFVDEIANNSEIPAVYETAGSLWNGKKVFLLMKLPTYKLVGDEVEQYLFFTNSHDGEGSLQAGISNVRVVCNNTLQMAERAARRTWKFIHSPSVKGRAMEAARTLQLAKDYAEVAQKEAEELAAIKLTNGDVERFFKQLFDVKSEMTNAQKNNIIQISDLYKNKLDLQNFRGTAWGLYNSVSDFVSNFTGMKDSVAAKTGKMDRFLTGEPLIKKAERILLAA